jgi:hypothetical protein
LNKFLVATDTFGGSAPHDVAEAVNWVGDFHRDVRAGFGPNGVMLLSRSRSPEELKGLWLAALANQRLLCRAVEARKTVLDRLRLC